MIADEADGVPWSGGTGVVGDEVEEHPVTRVAFFPGQLRVKRPAVHDVALRDLDPGRLEHRREEVGHVDQVALDDRWRDGARPVAYERHVRPAIERHALASAHLGVIVDHRADLDRRAVVADVDDQRVLTQPEPLQPRDQPSDYLVVILDHVPVEPRVVGPALKLVPGPSAERLI